MKRCARWLALCGLCIVTSAGYSAVFEIRNTTDAVGTGLNDTTPFIPEGGNNATTLGQARLNVLAEAGRIWGTLVTSSIPIIVDASVKPLTCTTNSGVLAQASPSLLYRNFPGAPESGVFYPSALADALSNQNLSEQPGGSTAGSADVGVTLNGTVNNTVGCLGGARFYYGFDHNSGGNLDLLEVLLHEFAHGLGFLSVVNPSTGAGSTGSDNVERFGIFDEFIFDEQLNLPWTALTDAQRQQSATRTGFLAWSGSNVNKWSSRFTAGITANGRMRLYAPTTVAPGSSVSHFDTAVIPNVLMRPNLSVANGNYTDVTPCALKDIGWTVARCIDAANSPPVAQAQTITTPEDTPVTITLGGTDPDADPLTYALVSSPARGSLSALSSAASPTTVFTPSANANGTDSFTFTVSDGASTSTAATVTINITPVNDAPVATPLTATVQAGQTVGITLAGTDVDGDALAYTVVTNPVSGTLTGTAPNLVYQPGSGFTGTDSFTYRVSDASLASTPVSVSITVTAAPATSGKSGGGGAIGLPFLALLAGLLAYNYRRKRRQLASSWHGHH